VTAITVADRFLLDASIWIGAMQPAAPYYEACRALVVNSDYPVAALDLTMIEIANVLGARDRRRRDAVDLCRLMTGRCPHLAAAADLTLIPLTLKLAIEHRLSAYDASYVAAAFIEGWTLVSIDIRDLVSKGLAITPDAAV
jgi:predicted nucleic acid-binding protein